jgi:hypothetical protein
MAVDRARQTRTGLSETRTGLWRPQFRNPGHWKNATRDWGLKSARERADSNVRESLRRRTSRQGPETTGLPAETAVDLELRQCVADDAVRGELVSGANSLLNREFF